MCRYLAGLVTGILLTGWAVLVSMTSDTQVILILTACFGVLTALFNIVVRWVTVRYASKVDA